MCSVYLKVFIFLCMQTQKITNENILEGSYYLKLGHGRYYEEVKRNFSEVTEWYRRKTGIPQCVEELKDLMCSLIPGMLK